MEFTKIILFKKTGIKARYTKLFQSPKQGRKRPLDTPKRMIERREREGEREKER